MKSRYLLVDNGLRSFVPPCFSWNVIDADSIQKVTTASELDLSKLELTKEKEVTVEKAIALGNLLVSGEISAVAAKPPSNKEGIRFTVTSIIGSAHKNE